MRKNLRLHLNEFLLLTLPILGIIIFGVYILGRRTPQSVRLVISETQLALGMPITSLKKGNSQKRVKRFFRMVTLLGYRGEKPSWWGENVYMDTRVNFTTANILFNDADIYGPATYDSKTGRYSFLFETQLPSKREFWENATCNISVVAMTETTPQTALGRVRFSKPLKELVQTSKRLNIHYQMSDPKSPFPILPRRYERPESAPRQSQ